MQKANLSVEMPIGNISLSQLLGKYYQDFTQAVIHFNKEYFGPFDEKGVPMQYFEGKSRYYQVYIIQYGLILHDLILNGENVKSNSIKLKSCMDWLRENKEETEGNIIWRNQFDLPQWGLKKGWVSGMYQGQALSLYLRVYQLFKDKTYFETATKIFNSFSTNYESGGFKRIDSLGCIWFEEYPTSKPSFVLNGFIYSIFGILDFYRVTKREDAKLLWQSCVNTLVVNLPKYDVWYWSVYDQLKEQLVSYYYQKNIHLPLMQIMFELTKEKIFDDYAIKWNNNLNNPYHRLITKIMYRIQPRLKKTDEIFQHFKNSL